MHEDQPAGGDAPGRPDGGLLMTIAYVLFVLAVVGFLMSFADPSFAWLILPCSGIFSLAVSVALVGRIERALSFLPGREVTKSDPVAK